MIMTTTAVLAQAFPPNTSQLGVILHALSSFSAALALLSAAIIFFGACYLFASKRRPAVLAAYLVLLPLPVIISISGWISGTIASLNMIAASPDLHIANQDIAAGFATSLISLYASILASAPSYFIIAYGLLSRTLNPPTVIGTKATNTARSSVLPQPLATVTTGPLPVVS